MPISFEKIGQYPHYLSEVHGVQFCIKDFCGFVAINKQLDETLRPLSRAHKSILYVESSICYIFLLRNKLKTAMQAWPCIAAKRAVKERTITQMGDCEMLC